MIKKIYKFITICLLAISLTIVFSIYSLPSKSVAQSSSSIELLQQGIKLYETEQYKESIKVWQTALNQNFQPLSKALILSNLSLSYQKLGNWQEAEQAIISSLEILNSLDITTDTYAEILAKALNTEGSLMWLKGNFSEAVSAWDLAASNYLKVGDTENLIKCKLNQAKALQAEGLSSKAKEILEQIGQELNKTPDSQLKATGLRYLGNVLGKVGDFRASETVLQSSLAISESSDTLLELGNTERALSDSYLATNQSELADKYAEAALDHYQQAFNSGNNIQAGLNQLSLAISLGKWSDIAFLIPKINQSLKPLVNSRVGVYTKLNFVRSVSCIKEIQDNHNFACVSKIHQEKLKQLLAQQKLDIKNPDWSEIAVDIKNIIKQAPDSKTKSYGIGELGKLYESQKKWQLAQNYTQQALLAIEGIEAPEIRYRWQWQLGRILEQQKDISEAIAAYSAAIENLKVVRNNLLIVNPEVQFSFRDNIEPIYREFVDLLLQHDRGKKVSQENLEQAIQSIDTLQLAEIENFLNCDFGSSLQLNSSIKNIEYIDANTAFIYPIILQDRLEVIFKLPGQPLKYHTNFVAQATVEQTIRELKRAIIRGYANPTISRSQLIYQWLIAPLEPYLENHNQIITLAFVLDGELRNIPMGVLYDSQQQEYLIQKPYSLVLLPRFQVFDIQTQPTELKVLGAGISEELEVANRYFMALNVTEELANIESNISSSILLNSQFTQANIQDNLERGDFSVVHLATHGNFSSNPEDTYLLLYDSDSNQGSLLKARNFDQLLRQSAKQRSIELLVLSACETAEGDSRAALGLAGVAIRAGAKSTLATLWQVNDQSTVKFMERFYQELSLPGTSKAMALHRAQQALVNDPNYKAPYYWASYVLVGNWL